MSFPSRVSQVRHVDRHSQHSLETSITDQTLQYSQEFQNSQSALKELPVPDEYMEDGKR